MTNGRARGLHLECGGAGDRLLLLLHGLGANSAVWRRLIPILEARWRGRWLASDFRGHGRSPYEGPYGYAAHAADIAALIAGERASDVTLLGHSFGGVVAALVGTGWFGPRPSRVLAFGVKIDWTDDEVQKARELTSRPARSFATRGEAVDRYLKVSGLHGLVDPESEDAAAGVIGRDGDFRVAMDPCVYGAVGPSIERILRLCEVPLRLAAGARDQMVSLDTMRRVDPGAVLFDGAGHNVHWEAPEHVWRWVESCRVG
jgi:pimeloyl-ACP methyl ester carboxylesterase